MANARSLADTTPSADGGSDRRWLAEAAGAETYLGALVRMLVQPATFTLAWTRGAKTISPLQFIAVSTTVVGVSSQLVQRGETSTTWLDIVNSVTPALMFALVGILIHAAYKVFGSRRAVETSLGLTLFTIAGPGLFFPLAMVGIFLFVKTHSTLPVWQYLQGQGLGTQLAIAGLLFGFYLWPRIVLGRVMHVAHRRRWWWSVLAILLAELAVAMLFGALQDYAPSTNAVFNWPRLIVGPTLHRLDFYW